MPTWSWNVELTFTRPAVLAPSSITAIALPYPVIDLDVAAYDAPNR